MKNQTKLSSFVWKCFAHNEHEKSIKLSESTIQLGM